MALSSPMSATISRHEITVLYFATAYTATGIRGETIELPILEQEGFSLSKLALLLRSHHNHTGLGSVLEMSRWSVDIEMVMDINAVILRGVEEVGALASHRTNTYRPI